MTRPFLSAKLIWGNIRETAKQIYLCITFVFVFSIEEKDTHQLKSRKVSCTVLKTEKI